MDTAMPTLAALVRERTGATWSRAKQLCEDGRVRVGGEPCLDPARRVAREADVVIDEQGPRREAGALPKGAILFQDRDIVVVDKPAGMLTVADVAGNKDTLADHLRTLLRRHRAGEDVPLGVVHRLDRETSGVMAFTRSPLGKRVLAAQFRAHHVDRVYLAIVHGSATARTIESDLVLDRGDGLRGSHGHFRRTSAPAPPEARHAVTHVRPLQALRGATLVECRLETGRQHQIRIHLAEAGHPLLGEPVYIRDHAGPRLPAPRTMLHAHRLGFTHPRTNARVSWQSELPADFAQLLDALCR